MPGRKVYVVGVGMTKVSERTRSVFKLEETADYILQSSTDSFELISNFSNCSDGQIFLHYLQ